MTYEEHYFIASVQWQGVHICSGTIVDELHIITTATCITNEKNIIYANLQVLTGTFNQNDFGQYGRIDDVEFAIIHDDYAPLQFWANDICILKVCFIEKSIENNNSINFCCSFNYKNCV